jgi:hypothetical protein
MRSVTISEYAEEAKDELVVPYTQDSNAGFVVCALARSPSAQLIVIVANHVTRLRALLITH